MSCSEWTEYRLEEVIEEFIDYRGRTPKKVNFGIPLITAKIVKSGRINTPNEFIREEDYESWMTRGIPKKGDVILTTEAPLGEVAQITSNEKIALAQRIITLRSNSSLLDNTFLKYLLQSPIMQWRLSERASGTTVVGIKSSELKKVKVNIPSLEKQKKIANILSSLDDKIELNNEMNKTLEEMAQSIFKRWFVDFEFPNKDGEPYKSSGGEMVESELGMIPKGWEIGTLDNIGTFKNGKKIRSELRDDNGKYIIYGSNGIIGKTNEVLQNNNCIILGRVGAYCGSVQLSLEPCWITDNAIIATAKEEKYLPYLHRFLLNYPLRESAGGSAQPLINQSILKSIQTSIPTYDLFEKYDNISKEILFKINQNIKENNKLSEIRDSLLPKLMSGEINV